MNVELELHGIDEAAAFLRARGARLAQPMQPLLEAVADAWATDFQANFERQGTVPFGPWPELSEMTKDIRRRRGFPADRPIQIRTSDLLHSIRLLEQGPDSVAVGSDLRYAAVLNDGGLETWEKDVPGPREVPARPFVVLHPQLIEDTVEMIDAYFFGDEAADA